MFKCPKCQRELIDEWFAFAEYGDQNVYEIHYRCPSEECGYEAFSHPCFGRWDNYDEVSAV